MYGMILPTRSLHVCVHNTFPASQLVALGCHQLRYHCTLPALLLFVCGAYTQTMWDQEGQLGRCYDAPTLAVLRATKARTDPLRLLRAL